MSERSKGDVSSSSSRVNNNANRIVKNPLLSASVTGLSYDDFPNKPLLLPAAPPVVHAPPAQPANALIAGILKRGKCVRQKEKESGVQVFDKESERHRRRAASHLLLPCSTFRLISVNS